MLLICFGTGEILNAAEIINWENDDNLTDWYKPVAVILSPISKEELFQTVAQKLTNRQSIATAYASMSSSASYKYYKYSIVALQILAQHFFIFFSACRQ